MKLELYSYRYAAQVLLHDDLDPLRKEVESVLRGIAVPLLAADPSGPGPVKRRKRKALRGDPRPRYFFLPVDQRELNSELDRRLETLGWEVHPRVVEDRTAGPKTALRADYRRGRLHVEVQFGNMARWYADVFKFQLAYSQDRIDAAILVVPKMRFANLIDENVAYFERVVRELPHAKMSLTLPILVIGVEPDNWGAVRSRYQEAARLWERLQVTRGLEAVPIPFSARVAEVPDMDEE